MIVRAVARADRPEWEALYAAYAAFYEVTQTAQMRAKVWSWLLDTQHDVNGLVAEDAGALVGFAHFRPFARPLAAASGLYLDDLFVTPAARGLGAAPALIDAVKREAQGKGHSVVRWITSVDNARARGLYDKVARSTEWMTYDLDV